jgi:NADH-quinone oxidoreductase subunit M
MRILTAITWLPIVGVAVIMLLPRGQARLAKAVALAAAGGSLVLSWGLLISFDRSSSEPQFTERTTWIPELGMTYSLGVDGLSFPMILLTTLLSVVALIASLKVDRNIKAYFAWMLLLEFAILGVFVARDWFLFYVFWEIALVPMFFLIGMWGGPKKERATLTFFLYTLGGSIFMPPTRIPSTWRPSRRPVASGPAGSRSRRSSRSSSASRSRSRCSRCTAGYRWPTFRPRRR